MPIVLFFGFLVLLMVVTREQEEPRDAWHDFVDDLEAAKQAKDRKP